MGEGECETKKESMIYFFLLENKSAFFYLSRIT